MKKHIIAALLLAIGVPGQAQELAIIMLPPAAEKVNPWKPTKNDLLLAGVQLLYGAADGTREEVLYHPNNLFRMHPELNRQWWDSRISWKNKEDTWVAISDANHTLRLFMQASDLATISLVLFEKKTARRQLWKVALRKAVLCYVARKAGFGAVYYLHFKN